MLKHRSVQYISLSITAVSSSKHIFRFSPSSDIFQKHNVYLTWWKLPLVGASQRLEITNTLFWHVIACVLYIVCITDTLKMPVYSLYTVVHESISNFLRLIIVELHIVAMWNWFLVRTCCCKWYRRSPPVSKSQTMNKSSSSANTFNFITFRTIKMRICYRTIDIIDI